MGKEPWTKNMSAKHSDEKEDKALIKKMMGAKQPKEDLKGKKKGKGKYEK